MILKAINSNKLGSPKWGIEPPRGKKVKNFGDKGRDGDPLFTLVDEGFKDFNDLKGDEPKVKGIRLPLNFAALREINTNYLIDGKPSGKSRIVFTMHSSKKNAEKRLKNLEGEFGGVHYSIFEYDGIDKTDKELIDWVLNTNQFSSDRKTKLFKATKISSLNGSHKDLFNSRSIEEASIKEVSTKGAEEKRSLFRKVIDNILNFLGVKY